MGVQVAQPVQVRGGDLAAEGAGELDGGGADAAVRTADRDTLPWLQAARAPQTDSVPTAPQFTVLTDTPPWFGLGFQIPGPPWLAFAHPELGVALAFTSDTMLMNDPPPIAVGPSP